jgi:tetratricopeptide (TPR) repeat protein
MSLTRLTRYSRQPWRERLSARYAESLVACDAVARSGPILYAAACRLETQSLQGQHQSATQGLQTLIAQTPDGDQRSWLLSLLAESQERAGRDRAATNAYQQSLALNDDLYTAIAYSDLLLRTGKTSAALQVLAALPETDAVVLRRATAWRRLGDARWTGARAMLTERAAALERRGDDPALHGRELALAALWLDDDAPRALTLARRNLLLQREPLDWWVALQSARQAKDISALAEIERVIQAAGLRDVRLSSTRPVKLSAALRVTH